MNRLSTFLFFLLILLILAFSSSHAQVTEERIISGQLRDNEGSPLPGVNIHIKGTTTGTTTDVEGRYSIRVPLGATLVFSFIGYAAREVVVTDANSKPLTTSSENQTNTVKPAVRDSLVKEGVAILTDETPSYKYVNPRNSWNTNGGINPHNIFSIRLKKLANGKSYYIVEDRPAVRLRKTSVQWSSSFALERRGKLPRLQEGFAQGRPMEGDLSWRGADQAELFSWGPAIADLEFDGSSYLFDHTSVEK